tara:strand:- start:493 stop:1071 length:579 start_codon:yes stop_codon:yes gene_type:complete
MVRLIIVIGCIVNTTAQAQQRQEVYIRTGLLTSSMTFSPSVMLNQNEKNAYLTGFFEGFLDQHISFRGEGNYLIGGLDETAFYNKGFRTTFGILLHANKKNLDAYVGLMPGIYISKLADNISPQGESQLSVVPVISVNVGGAFYMWKYAHVFMNVTYTSTNYRKVYRDINGRAGELMVSAGIGFNINVIREK